MSVEANIELLVAYLRQSLEKADDAYKDLLADFVSRTKQLDDMEKRKIGLTAWAWKHDLSEITTRDMTGDPNWVAVEMYRIEEPK